jgi:hypothetical protein
LASGLKAHMVFSQPLLLHSLKSSHHQLKGPGGGAMKWSCCVDWKKKASSFSLLCPEQPCRYCSRCLRPSALRCHQPLRHHRSPCCHYCRLCGHILSQLRLRRHVPCNTASGGGAPQGSCASRSAFIFAFIVTYAVTYASACCIHHPGRTFDVNPSDCSLL